MQRTPLSILGLVLACGLPVEAAEFKSKHYHVWTDAEPALAKQVATHMEGVYAAYGQVVGTISVEPVFKIRLYKKKADYNAYILKTHKIKGDRFRYVHYRSGSAKNEVLGWRVADEALYPRLQHEGFHQYLRHIVNKPPQWLNEGMAELLEASDIAPDGKITVRFSALHRRLREGVFKVEKGALNKGRFARIAIPRLVKMPKKKWLAEERVAYATSWGLVYYMLLDAEQKYVPTLVNYMNALEKDNTEEQNLQAAYRAAFGKVDVHKVGREFERWVGATPAPGYADFKAGRDATAAKDYAKATAAFERAAKADPGNARYQYYLGLTAYSARRYDEASKALLLTGRMDPDYGMAFYILGKVRYQQKRMSEARKLLEHARGLGVSASKIDPWLKKAGGK